jgi:hypothetical protein
MARFIACCDTERKYVGPERDTESGAEKDCLAHKAVSGNARHVVQVLIIQATSALSLAAMQGLTGKKGQRQQGKRRSQEVGNGKKVSRSKRTRQK